MTRARLSMLAVLALGASLATGCTEVDQAVFRTAWTVRTGSGATGCDAVGADKTEFLFTSKFDQMGFDELFDCVDGAGDTAPLPLDDFTYVAALLSCPDATPGCPGSTTIQMSQPQDVSTDVCDQISGGTCFVDLPQFDFVITNL